MEKNVKNKNNEIKSPEVKKEQIEKIQKKQTIENKLLSFTKIINPVARVPETLGQKAADKLSKWAGSWTFIIGFGIMLVVWMVLNTTWVLFGSKWDQYPFILLNLVLSCMAAFQAPIILMSQNRQSERDRLQAKYDYSVNRKAEREIQTIKKQLDRMERSIIKKEE